MSGVDIWKLILPTDLEKSYPICGARARAASFIIPSRQLFVFEVSRYVSFPSSPDCLQKEIGIASLMPSFTAKVTTDIGERGLARSMRSAEWKFHHDSTAECF